MTPKVTEEQLKSLKLFSYYCMSHGSSEVDVDVYTDVCDYDYMSEEAYSNDGTRIELYDAISDVLKNILDENDVYQETSDCDNRGTIKINIDCKERILSLNAWQWQYTTLESEAENTIEEIKENYSDELYELILSFFNQLHEKNVSEGYVDFNGGGDSGDCNGFAYGDFQGQIDLDEKIIDFMYEQLENHMGGWEINEGSQGRFIFNNESKDVILEFQENQEEEVPVPVDFVIKF
jgi:hypothetical protein